MSDVVKPPDLYEEIGYIKERLYALEQTKPNAPLSYTFEVCASHAGPAPSGTGPSLTSTPWGPTYDCVLVGIRADVDSPSSDTITVQVIRNDGEQRQLVVQPSKTTGIAYVDELSLLPSQSFKFYISIQVDDWSMITTHAYFKSGNPMYVSGGLNFLEDAGITTG